jgi:hypothetical protein
MAEIGEPERRRVLIPDDLPAEPVPYVRPPDKPEPVKKQEERLYDEYR